MPSKTTEPTWVLTPPRTVPSMPGVQHHLLPDHLGQGLLQLADGLRIQGDGADHGAPDAPGLLVGHVPEEPGDVGQHPEPVPVHHQAEEVGEGLGLGLDELDQPLHHAVPL